MVLLHSQILQKGLATKSAVANPAEPPTESSQASCVNPGLINPKGLFDWEGTKKKVSDEMTIGVPPNS